MSARTIRVVACGALGDALLTTPSFRAIKERDASSHLVVYCTTQGQYELYQHNPYIDRLVPPGWLNRCERWVASRVCRLKLLHDWYGNLKPSLLAVPATDIIAALLDVRVRDRRLQVFLTEQEEAAARRAVAGYRDPVGIHVTSRFSPNQHWPMERWTELVRRNPQLTFVQLGLSDEPAVPGAVDFRGKLGIRASLAILKQCRSFVGVVSFFAHATNAAGIPGVVLYGPSTPAVWGHGNNMNVNLALPCAPCVDLLQNAPCPYGAPCMADIMVDDVEARLIAQVRRASSPQAASAF